MKKEEILKELRGIKKGMPLDETSSKILESLKRMKQLERVETLCEIMDAFGEIDFQSETMQEILVKHIDELVALRTANRVNDNPTPENTSSEATSKRALELLNN